MRRMYIGVEIEELVDDLSHSLQFDQDLTIKDLLWKPVIKTVNLRLGLRRMFV